MVLMVFLSSRISPFTSTVIFFDRSPAATAFVTSAMLRTWAVRLPAIELTRVGQVLPRAGDARHVGLAAELAFGADLARDARHLGGERAELIHHRVDGVLELEDLALHVDGDLLRQVAGGDRRRHVGDVAHLAGEVAGHRVDRVGRDPSTCRRRPAPRPGRRACLRCRPRARRASPRRRTSRADPPWC